MENEKFTSKYTDREVRADQHLAEMMIERQATINRVKLKEKFWNEREWKPKFLHQQRLAAALLRTYSYKCLSNVLNSKQGIKILSLKAPWLDELLEAEKNKLDSLQELKTETLKNVVQDKAVSAETFGEHKKKDLFEELEGL